MPSIDDQITRGAKEDRKETSETTRNLKKDRTLIVTKLTSEPPLEPEVVTGLKTMKDVFEHFKPEISVDFEDTEGQPHTEEIRFTSPADFPPSGISKQSEFLMNLQLEQDFLGDIIRQFRSNKQLRTVLEDKEMREVFLSALDKMIAEIPD